MASFMSRVAGLAAAVVIAGPALAESPVAAAAPPAPLGGAEWWFDAWRVFEMWKQSKGAGITVAIVESGVNSSIPELAGSVLPGVDIVGGGDGRHDYAANGHGTAMAAHIVANGAGTGMRGVAPEAHVLPVIIGHEEDRYNTGIVAQGITWAVDHGAQVISMSFVMFGARGEDGCPADVQDAIQYALEHNAVVVAGAGNDGDSTNRVSAPASCKGVIAVGAVDRNARPWVHSQRQSYVDVAAPGVDMRSVNQKGEQVEGSGTSDATALTSAAVALVWSKHRDLTNREVVARLLYTLRDKPPAGTKDLQRGYGTLVPARALTDNIPRDAPNPVFDELVPAASPSPSRPSGDSGDSTGSAVEGGSAGGGGIPVAVFVIGGVGIVAVLLFLGMLGARRRPRAASASYYPPSPAPYPPQQSPGSTQQGYGQPGFPPPQYPPPSQPPPVK